VVNDKNDENAKISYIKFYKPWQTKNTVWKLASMRLQRTPWFPTVRIPSKTHFIHFGEEV